MNHQIKVMLQPHFDRCQLILLASRPGDKSEVVGQFDSELDALIYLRETWLGQLPLHSPWLASLPATVNILTNSVTYDLTQAVADMQRYFGKQEPQATGVTTKALRSLVDQRKGERLQKSARAHKQEYAKVRPDVQGCAMHWWNGLSKADRDFLRDACTVRDRDEITSFYEMCG